MLDALRAPREEDPELRLSRTKSGTRTPARRRSPERIAAASRGGRPRRRWRISSIQPGARRTAAIGHGLRLRAARLASARDFRYASMKGVGLAVEDLVRVAGLEPGAVVLDHPVRVEHVGSDLASPLDRFLVADELLLLGPPLVQRPLVEAGAQDLHRHVAVAPLAALVLAGHDDPGRKVRQAHGRVRDVDVLAAGAARAVRVDPQVLVRDLDLDVFVHLRRDVDRRERGVAALRRVEGGDPDQPVDPHLALQVPVGVVADDVEGRALQARLLAVLPVDQLRLPPAALAEAQVHPQEHLGPVLRLGPAGARVDHQPGVLRVLGRAHLDGELQVVGERGGGLQRLARVRLGRLSLLQQLGEGQSSSRSSSRRSAGLELSFVDAALPEDLLRFFGAGPEIGGGGLLPQAFERAPRGVGIKDSREATGVAPRRLSGRRSGRRVRSL